MAPADPPLFRWTNHRSWGGHLDPGLGLAEYSDARERQEEQQQSGGLEEPFTP